MVSSETVASGKILTVSYGTFSCSLGGLDDPFGIMIVIAEYCRKLSDIDPSFGTNPSTPNAQLLAKNIKVDIERFEEPQAVSSFEVNLSEPTVSHSEKVLIPETPHNFLLQSMTPVKSTHSGLFFDNLATDGVEPRGVPEETEKVVVKLQRLRAAIDNRTSESVSLAIADDLAEPTQPVVASTIKNLSNSDAVDLDKKFQDSRNLSNNSSDMAYLVDIDGLDEHDISIVPVVSTLTEEDETELLAELAQLEEEFSVGSMQAFITQKLFHNLPETSSAKLAYATNSIYQSLSEPDGKRGHYMMAQMKAAVVLNDVAETDCSDDFHILGESSKLHLAPLKLIASQRVF